MGVAIQKAKNDNAESLQSLIFVSYHTVFFYFC